MIFAMITEKWKKGNVTPRPERGRERFFRAFPFEQNWMAPNRSFGFFFFFFCQKRASSIQKSRGKKISKISLIARTNFFSLFLLFGKIREKIASQHTEHTRFFFGLRSVRLLRARDIYKKRETTHLASWIRRLSENGPLQKASRSLEHSLFIVSKSRLKIQKQREREGFY